MLVKSFFLKKISQLFSVFCLPYFSDWLIKLFTGFGLVLFVDSAIFCVLLHFVVFIFQLSFVGDNFLTALVLVSGNLD